MLAASDYLEVKTTNGSSRMPFFLTRTERELATEGSVATLQEWSDKLGRYGPRTLRRRPVQVAPV